jgi:hypothetical protein
MRPRFDPCPTGMRLRDLPMAPPQILAEIDAEEPRRLAAE